MKLSDIKAAIQAKAVAFNIVPPAQVAPPVQTVPTTNPAPVINPPAPAKPKVVKTGTKKTSTSVNQTPQQPVKEQTPPPPVPPIVKSNEPVAPLQQSKPKTTKSKSTSNNTGEDIEVIVAKYLRPGVDYAVIPHTTKPSLLKGGAERLAFIFGFHVSCEIVNRIENFDHSTPANSFVQYESKVIVYNRDGAVVSEGYGSCNSSESKFLKQPFANRINTVLKMSKKRAYVDAILTATCSSSVFTQDMEDIANFQEIAK